MTSSRLVTRIAATLLALVALALPARAFDTAATAAYVYDVTTDTVLLSKNADTPLPPASMSKLMTLNMLFEALRGGRVDLDTQFGVSSRARQMGGSTMFLNERDRPTVEQLIQGIIVMSGNDACVVVAEGLSGSEEAFANQMTTRAHQLGMTNTTLANASGWPNPGHRMSMRDLGILATHLIRDFPEYYEYFDQQEFLFDNRAPANTRNRNPLLGMGLGADGLKTGHTTEAGYGLVGSAEQDGRRIVFVITGLPSERARLEESERVINWAFRQFVQSQILTQGQRVATADVWLGIEDSVDLVAPADESLLLPAMQTGSVSAVAHYTTPIEAPVRAGQEIGRLVVTRGDLPQTEYPLVAASDVSEGGFVPRMKLAASILATDLIGSGFGGLIGGDDTPDGAAAE